MNNYGTSYGVPIEEIWDNIEERVQDNTSRAFGTGPWIGGGNRGKKRKKVVPEDKNIKIRKFVQPKTAVMVLNEMKTGITFEMEENSPAGEFCMSITMDGQKYLGYGASKQAAKHYAAEAALVSFVDVPAKSNSYGEVTDNTPWSALASFAMYKLFSDWLECKIGGKVDLNSEQAKYIKQHLDEARLLASLNLASKDTVAAAGGKGEGVMHDLLSTHLGAFHNGKVETSRSTGPAAKRPNTSVEAMAVEKDDPEKMPKPAKQVHSNAGTMHPVMVLHQMNPGLVYTISKSTTDEGKPYFHLSAQIEGRTFKGEGISMKKAKYCLAKEAIRVLYQVYSTFVETAA